MSSDIIALVFQSRPYNLSKVLEFDLAGYGVLRPTTEGENNCGSLVTSLDLVFTVRLDEQATRRKSEVYVKSEGGGIDRVPSLQRH